MRWVPVSENGWELDFEFDNMTPITREFLDIMTNACCNKYNIVIKFQDLDPQEQTELLEEAKQIPYPCCCCTVANWIEMKEGIMTKEEYQEFLELRGK